MVHKYISRYFFLVLFVAGLASCESAIVDPNENAVIKKPSLIVLNEGAFGAGNASLDAINLSNDERKVNVLPNLGDVGSDVEIIDGKIFVVSSGSTKMYVIDPIEGETLASLTLPQPASPNAIAKINDNEALVTHLFWNRLDVIDLTTNTVVDSIRVGQGTVDIVTMNGFAYATASTKYLYKIDLSAKTLVDSVEIGDIPQRILVDQDRDQLVTMSWGNWQTGTPGKLATIDVSNFTVKRSNTVSATSLLNRLIMGSGKAYVIFGDRIETMNLATGELSAFSPVFGLSAIYDDQADELYIGRGDYTSPGKVEVYDGTTATIKRTYEAGIAPAHFAFYR
jgi:DNA-binding beta-propeller fold protein YncE